MAAGLLLEAGRGIDHHEGEICGGGAGGHVGGVLHVARAVGDDELALGRRRIPIGNIDRDALLTLRSEAVGHEGQVEITDAAVL